MNARPRIRESAWMAGVTLTVVVLLPLVAVLAFVLRAGLVAGAAAAVLLGMVAFAVSPRFRDWLRYETDPGLTYNGLRLDTGVALDDRHAWARFEGGEATVGADDLLQAVLGPVDRVELPPPRRRVRRGETLFRLHHGDREVAVPSPVTGRVAETNVELIDSPHLVNEAPFGAGWAVRVEGPALRRDRRALLSGGSARAWFRGEVDRLLAELLPPSAEAVPALPDGGEIVAGLHHHVDDATWRRLHAAFFAAGGTRS